MISSDQLLWSYGAMGGARELRYKLLRGGGGWGYLRHIMLSTVT